MQISELLDWTGRSTLAVVAIALILFAFRQKLSATTIHLVWRYTVTLVIGSFFVLPLLPSWEIIPDFSETPPIASPKLENIPFEASAPQAEASKTTRPPLRESEAPIRSSNREWWVWLWVAVALALSIRTLLSLRFLSSLRSAFPADHPARVTTEILASEFGLPKNPRIVAFPGSPMTWGVFKPMISLPEDCGNWDSVRLEIVLRHELAHIARHDPFWLLMSQLALSVFWFHPGLWIAFQHLRETRELAVDESVVAQGVLPSGYAETILAFSKEKRSAIGSSALCGIQPLGRRRAVGNRIEAILHGRKTFDPAASRFALGLVYVAMFTALIVSLTASTESPSPPAVVIDPGDYRVTENFSGSDFNLEVALQLEKALKEKGIVCRLTRRTAEVPTIQARRELSNRANHSVYVGISQSSSRSPNSQATEILRPEGRDQRAIESFRFAHAMNQTIRAETGETSISSDASSAEIFRDLDIPALLIERDFLTNPDGSEVISSETYREKLAQGIANGVEAFLAGEGLRTLPYDIVEPLEPDAREVPLAEGFDFPVGAPNGEGYFVYRGYNSRGHLGEDWNGEGGGNSDFGDPVHSIADGFVIFASDVRKGWGKVIIIRHRYREKSGIETLVDSLYGHLDEIKIATGDRIQRGEVIGTIGRGPHNMYAAHLHFEIRRNLKIGMDRAFFGKSTENYYSPRSFINARRP